MEAPVSTLPQSRRNLELKARLASLNEARRIAESLEHRRLADQHQLDTYFCCSRGRLKLREIRHVRAELIAYARPDQLMAKESCYYIIPVTEPEPLRQALAWTLGVRGRVEKHRVIYLHRNVRIHLDTVTGLGTFLELEAVIDASHDEAASQALVTSLQQLFHIVEDDLVASSYGDLLASPVQPQGHAGGS